MPIARWSGARYPSLENSSISENCFLKWDNQQNQIDYSLNLNSVPPKCMATQYKIKKINNPPYSPPTPWIRLVNLSKLSWVLTFRSGIRNEPINTPLHCRIFPVCAKGLRVTIFFSRIHFPMRWERCPYVVIIIILFTYAELSLLLLLLLLKDE